MQRHARVPWTEALGNLIPVGRPQRTFVLHCTVQRQLGKYERTRAQWEWRELALQSLQLTHVQRIQRDVQALRHTVGRTSQQRPLDGDALVARASVNTYECGQLSWWATILNHLPNWHVAFWNFLPVRAQANLFFSVLLMNTVSKEQIMVIVCHFNSLCSLEE